MIPDVEGIQFLQWCLPRLHLRWPGFRKVRRQVYRRINRRLQELGLPTVAAYRAHLEEHPAEWPTLDTFCQIGISRFYRDRSVFLHLEHEVLPHLARLRVARGEDAVNCWSVGCAGGEEPYTLVIIWRHCLATQFPMLGLRIVATDVNPAAIRRAERGCYRASSVKDLPPAWRGQAFVQRADELCLKDEYRAPLAFLVQDIRTRSHQGPFHLICCRNLVFTYFDEALQKETMPKLIDALAPGGALVIGKIESLPDGPGGIEPWSRRLGTYRKSLDLPRA